MEESRNADALLTVTLHGLMVIRFDEGQRLIEVGILQGIPGHEFEVVTSGHTIPDVKTYLGDAHKVWRLEVANIKMSSVREDAGLFYTGSFDRRNPKGNGSDYRWTTDLESDEFYGREIEMYSGMLNPIIHITSGTLSTQCQTFFLDKKQGSDSFQPFGYVAEIMAVTIPIREEEQAVMKVADTGREIFRFDYNSGTKFNVEINNLPPHHGDGMGHPSEATHFQNYYLLFPNHPSQRFEFKNDRETGEDPIYMCPTLKTPDPFICGSTFLGKRKTPLD